MQTERVMEVLRHVEWHLGDLGQRLCPWCHEPESTGHAANCNLAALLFDGRAVTTTDSCSDWRLGDDEARAAVQAGLTQTRMDKILRWVANTLVG